MIVQNEHWNGQPRPASKLVRPPTVRRGARGGDERDRRAGDVGQVEPCSCTTA